MTPHSSSESTRADDEIVCPFCASTGWPASLRTYGYAAVCGSAWDMAGYSSQSEPCRIIARLRLDLDLASIAGAA